MIYMFISFLYHFSLKCMIKNFIYSRTIPLRGTTGDKQQKVVSYPHTVVALQICYPHIVWNNVLKFHENRASSFWAICLSLVQRNRFTRAQLFLVFCSEYTMCTCSCTVGKKELSFSMPIGNEELMHTCAWEQ